MLLFKTTKPLGVLFLALGLTASGAYLYHRYQSAEWARRYAEYQRQLQGQLTLREKEIEAINTQLGLARSQLATQGALEQKYQTLLTQRDDAFKQFRRAHALRMESISDSILQLRQQIRQGTEKAHEVALPTQALGPSATTARPAISYEYVDKDGRLQLTDPDIWSQGDEVIQLRQFFRVKGAVLRQIDGSLMTERIQLLEVVPDSTGSYRELAEASLVDADFTYANAPMEPAPPLGWESGLVWMATVGTSFRARGRLRFGGSARLVRLGAFGLAAGLSSDLTSLEGSGGDAFLTFTPSLHGRELALALGGGVHLPIGGAQRVLPSLTLNFAVHP